MKILAHCTECFTEEVAGKKIGDPFTVRLYEAEIDDNASVTFTCPVGHSTLCLHRSGKHQLLFESGCLALLDGYPNEAASTIAASLERAYEFFIRVACRVLGIDDAVFADTWKHVAAQSERQLGAFLFLHAALTKSPFDIKSKLQEFRNKVIHKGHLVRSAEVEHYGQAVFDLIRHLMDVLSTNCNTEMLAEINEAAERRKAAAKDAGPTLWISGDEWDLRKSLSFETYFGDLRRKKKGA
jgi:uncharacterized protein (DUF2267 family)